MSESGEDQRKTRDDFRFCHSLQVRFRDCDPMQHVNNAVYFTYLEQGRFAYWRRVVGVLDRDERSFIIARASCDYRSPALAGEWLDVWLRTSSIGRSSFVLDYEVLSGEDGRMVATAQTVQVTYDYVANRSRPVPDELVEKLERFEERRLRRE